MGGLLKSEFEDGEIQAHQLREKFAVSVGMPSVCDWLRKLRHELQSLSPL